MKNVLTLILLFLSLTMANAVETSKPRKASIGGTVIDSENKQPIEYATIALYTTQSKTLVSGGITDLNGFFLLKNIAEGQYVLEVKFMGFNPFSLNSVMVTDTTKELNLGNIILEPTVNKLADIDIVANKAPIEYKIDKKIINVSQQLTAISGTAVDVLENVPSIKVDIDGNVSLRGSESFTVLIDNRPTALSATDALRQIPASAIENIEIITNPSAKYEPDGASGIINIITKKNAIDGFSGLINANAGLQNKYGSDFTIDYRQDKWHYSLGADFNHRENPGTIKSNRRVGSTDDTITYTNSSGDFTRMHESWEINGGIDYTVNPKINLGTTLRYGNNSHGNESSVDYFQSTNLDSTINKYKTENDDNHGGTFYSVGLYYKQIFDRQEHYLEIKGNVDGQNGDEHSNNLSRRLDGTMYQGQKSTEKGPGQTYRIQVDYARPLIGTQKLELGLQGMYAPSTDENTVNKYDTSTQTYVLQDLYSYKTDYTRKTFSAYAIYSGEWGDFGYQAGLRGEYTYQYLKMNKSSESYRFEKPGIFPTLHFSYKMPADQQTMLSYTRRINRPNPWQLEPFLTWIDAYTIRSGNPELEPEYINSMDFAYQKKMEANFISIEAYYRITENKIEQIQSQYSGAVILNTFENVGSDYSLGSELTFNYSQLKWYQLNLMGDLYDYRRTGTLDGEDFAQHSFNWNLRMGNTFRIGSKTRFQGDLNYTSKSVTAQGTEAAFFVVNVAAKQDFMDHKLTATLQLRNLLGTAKRERTTQGSDFYTYQQFKPDAPQVMLTLSYKLNNYKTKRENQGGEGENNSENGGE